MVGVGLLLPPPAVILYQPLGEAHSILKREVLVLALDVYLRVRPQASVDVVVRGHESHRLGIADADEPGIRRD
eukprot:11352654-Prorocentrum_lima.AAC.1